MNMFVVVDLFLYIKKEEGTEYTGMGLTPRWGGPVSLHEGTGTRRNMGG